MIRAVLDTNVVVSALIKPEGKPGQILDRRAQFHLLLSDDILAEASDVVRRRHIQRRFHLSEDEIEDYLSTLRSYATLISDAPVENVIHSDPPDNLVLACAVGGGADYLVSGDEHMLQLKQHHGVEIVTPARFLEILMP